MQPDSSYALTGPAAAAVLGLDGFSNPDLLWPDLWCAPVGTEPADRLIRTRRWTAPLVIDNQVIAAPHLVLRHLNALHRSHPDSYRQVDGIDIDERIALATEHAMRDGLVTRSQLTFTGGPQLGSHLLRQYLEWVDDEPCTGSYPETRFSWLLRSHGVTAFRQIPILHEGRIAFRADFALPIIKSTYRPRRPAIFSPQRFALVEIDGRRFHDTDSGFERDHRRDLLYRMLGFRFISLTARHVDDDPLSAMQAVFALLQNPSLRRAA